MKNLLIGCFLFALISCEKQTMLCCTVIDTAIDIVYKNTAGEDLLNPDTEGHLGGAMDIRTYSLKNGAKTGGFYGNLGRPAHYHINWSEEGSIHILRLHFDTYPENFDGNQTTMFIRYKDGSEDKFVGEFNENRRNNTLLQRVWLNDELVWDINSGNYQHIEVIK